MKNTSKKKLALEFIRLAGEMQDVAREMRKFKRCEDLMEQSDNLLVASAIIANWAKIILLK